MDKLAAAIAVDVGGTEIKGGLVTLEGHLLRPASMPTPPVGSVPAIVDFIQRLQGEASRLGLDVVAAGVVTPGMVDETSGVVAYASNLGWSDLPLGGILEQQAGIPVHIGHDVRSAGLAERALGSTKGEAELFFVIIGTGIAAAILTGGRPVRGALGAAGEFGHIPVVADGEACTCGQRGCLEVYVSGAGIARRYAAQGGRALSTQQIAQRLGRDPLADRIWDEGVKALAQGLTIATLVLDPGHIVLGGGFSRAGNALLDPLTTYLTSSLAWRSPPPVSLSNIGADAGILGAAILAFNRSGYPGAADGWGGR